MGVYLFIDVCLFITVGVYLFIDVCLFIVGEFGLQLVAL